MMNSLFHVMFGEALKVLDDYYKAAEANIQAAEDHDPRVMGTDGNIITVDFRELREVLNLPEERPVQHPLRRFHYRKGTPKA